MTVNEAIEWLKTSWEEGLDAVFNDDTADWFVNFLFNFLEGNWGELTLGQVGFLLFMLYGCYQSVPKPWKD
jgi:hypothetical protein